MCSESHPLSNPAEGRETAHLILALAYDLHHDVVESTCRATVSILDDVLLPLKRHDVSSSVSCGCEENRDRILRTSSERRLRPSQVHLIVVGPKQIFGDSCGIGRPEWEKQWTHGEMLFGNIVQRIGLDRFSPRGDTRLIANLLDVKVPPGGMMEELGRRSLLEEVGSSVTSTLKLRKCPPIGRATIVLPINTNVCSTEKGDRQRSEAKEVLRQCWENEIGLLSDTEIGFSLVDLQ